MLIRVAGLGFQLVGLRISKRDGSELEQGDMLGRRPVFGTLVRQPVQEFIRGFVLREM